VTKDAASPAAASPDRAERVERLERKIHNLHRSVLDKTVLQRLLPVRAATLAHRSASPDAQARLARFRAASASYSAPPDEAGGAPSYTRTIELDSLSWCVPLPHPEDPVLVARALGHQDFPYRTLTQTRDVAIGGAMIDIGANVGRMSIPRVVLGDVTAAYCAEPDPLNYRCLVQNVRSNHLDGLVLPDRVAIGSSNGTARLMRASTSGGHRVLDPETRTKHEVVEVESLTLDTWVERIGLDLPGLVFVKLDAQGSEVHVLRGATRVLACQQVAWQIEVDLALLSRRGFGPRDLYEPITRHFTHFVDLNRQAEGERVRPTTELADALAYLGDGRETRTDVMTFTLAVRASR
jgi:FkbM family methyltransferase